MQFTVSDSAKARLRELLVNKAKKRVRIALEAGGCAGVSQKLEISPLTLDSDLEVTMDEINFVFDPKSASLLEGLHLDWTSTLMEKRFIFNFPLKKSACSCGTSFSL